MSSSNRIVWIDDTPSRKQTADDIGAEFVDVQKHDLAAEIDALLKGSKPRLVILDHFLDKSATTNLLFQRGSTIAEAIKEHWPACPVVGVTAASNVNDIDARTKQAYDALYPFVNFSRYIPRIETLPGDFSAIEKAKIKKPRDLLKFLRPPEDEMDRLEDALPDDLKVCFGQASTGHSLFRWVKRLLDRPGFLLSNLWAATTLGLNEKGFDKVAGIFMNAKYTGAFAIPDEPHYWSSQLLKIVYDKCKPNPNDLSWHVGRQLPGIKEAHHSSCYRCTKEYPEIVAYLDETSSEQRAMHLKCTVCHPRYKRELYFEDIRMMKGT